MYAPTAYSMPRPDIMHVLCPDKKPPLIILRIIMFSLLFTGKIIIRLCPQYIHAMSPNLV